MKQPDEGDERQSKKKSPDDYWHRSRQPFASLVFLLPLLIAYEAGVLFFGGAEPDALRNGADFWMRSGLLQAGLQEPLFLPALVIGLLFLWQIVGRYRWRISTGTLLGMTAESVLFAFGLVAIGQLHQIAYQNLAADFPTTVDISNVELAQAVGFIGAGVYEEVLFRLCALPLCYVLFRMLMFTGKWSAAMAIITTSLVFSLAHYLVPSMDGFSMYTFTFRATAGMFFALLFVKRGFGITVGCHALYDLIVGILLVTPFQ